MLVKVYVEIVGKLYLLDILVPFLNIDRLCIEPEPCLVPILGEISAEFQVTIVNISPFK